MSLLNNLRNPSVIIVSAILLFTQLSIQSCDDNEPTVVPDTELPALSVTGLAEGQEVWNKVTISMEATDNEAVSMVEFFVDNNLISSIDTSSFQFEWDSNTVPDGPHIINITGTDASGNMAEQQFNITIKNVLVSISIAGDQLIHETDYNERGFVFLSDEAGGLIAVHEYDNGEDFELRSPAFDGETFYLTEVLAEDDASDTDGHAIRLWTFARIERGGNWVVKLNSDKEISDYVGDANLDFINDGGLSYRAFSNGGDEVFVDADNLTSSIRLGKVPGKLYVKTEAGDLYHLYSDIVTGTNTIDLSLVTTPLLTHEVTLPEETSWASVSIDGYLEEGFFEEPYRIGYFGEESGKFMIDYPGQSFAAYFAEIELETDDFYYQQGTTNELFTIQPLQNEVAFSFTDGSLTYSANGQFDFLTLTFEDGFKEDYWWFILPQGTDEAVPALELPEELASYNVPVFAAPDTYTVSDYDGIENYEGLTAYIRTSSYGADEFYEEGRNYIDIRYDLSAGGD